MIFRNSLLSIFRSIGKTTLFTILIFSLTLALTLAVSVWISVDQFLERSDQYYTTIGHVEYRGANYPNDTANDTQMAEAINSFDIDVIANDNATLLWNEPTRSLGYIDGFWRSDNYMPDRMNSVFVIYPYYYPPLVVEVVYSLAGKVNNTIFIDEDFGTFEKGHYYLVFGEVYQTRSPQLQLRVSNFENEIADSIEVEIPRYQDITSDTEGEPYLIPEESVLVEIANTLEVTNNSVLVNGTDDLLSMLAFHQEEQYIIEGRAFSDEEYANGDRVIVISKLIAARLGIGIGDTLDLSIAVSERSGVYNSYRADLGFSFKETFKVVGIVNTVNDKSWYVYIPKSTDAPSSPNPIGYSVGYAIIDNEKATEFRDRVESIMVDRFHLTIYDQGYSAVAVPFNTILGVAKIVTAVCSLMVLAVLILFGFLFVHRQRETTQIMMSLGAGWVRVCGYFLFSAGLISLIATTAGAIAGYYLHDGIISLVAKAAENYSLIDSRYSNGNLSISRILEFAPDLELQQFLSIGAAVFVLAIIACMAFVISTFFTWRPSQRNQRGPNKERKTSHLSGGSIKYAFLSILRGGTRSLVVPILGFVIVFFFGQLASTSLRFQEQLDTIYENTSISGNFMDINGKQLGNLLLNAYDVLNLYRTGEISTLTVSSTLPYYYLGTSFSADGTDLNIPPLYMPNNGFAIATLKSEIDRGPDLVAINDIRTSPEFYYADTVKMDFLTGYDESFLTVPTEDQDVSNCIIPSSLMEEMGVVLGEKIRVAINYPYTSEDYDKRIFYHFDLRVVGSYEKQGARDTIYIPLALFFDTAMIWGAGRAAVGVATDTFDTGYTINEDQKERLLSTTFNSANFTLADIHALDSFKEYLAEYGYSQVHHISKIREFIVLKDASFNNSVSSVMQQIQYINTLYPFLYVLVGIISVVVSYLMVVSRKMEFAIMRGLGTTRTRSFLSFFIEQSLLSVLGIIIGFSTWIFFWGTPRILHLALTLGFLVCYLLGSAISVTIMNHTNVLTILSDRE